MESGFTNKKKWPNSNENFAEGGSEKEVLIRTTLPPGIAPVPLPL